MLTISNFCYYAKDIKNYPIYLIFYCFPILSLFFHTFKIDFNYDYFWVPAFAALLFISFAMQTRKVYSSLLLSVTLLLLLKYFVPFCYDIPIKVTPLIMDGKWFVYLIYVILWAKCFGLPDKYIIYRGALFFSYVYILYTIARILLRIPLGRTGLLMESNYDGFMILMGFCFIGLYSEKRRDYWIFVIATLLTELD